MTYDNTNRGVLRTNDKKHKDTQPDWRGEINVNGQEYWLSGWIKDHPNMGGNYYSLSVTPKDKAIQDAKQAVQETPVYNDTDSDSIPF